MKVNIAKSVYLSFAGLLLLTKSVLGQIDQHLQQAIESSLAAEKLTGAVWTIVESDGSIHTSSAGIKNNDSQEPLMPTDRVHVGSIAKTVLAAGVLHLATTGKLNINDPVKKYLPGVRFINPWEATDPITLRHLLDHTSGLSDLRLWHVFSTTADPNGPLSDFFARDSSILQVQARPGSQFSYSNIGYTLLGMVIEAVVTQRYETYLDISLLRPLGMHNSTFKFVTQTGDIADDSLAMGHLDNGETTPALPVYVRPAAQFTTTAMDMGLFLKFMMSDGRINGREFIKHTFLAQLGKAHQTDASKNGLAYGYGLGASNRDRHGVQGIAHSGNILGYHAMIYLFPDKQKAFFISRNMDSEKANYEVFNEILIKHLGLMTQGYESSKTLPREFVDWNGYYMPAISKVVPFGYIDYITGYTKVTVKSKGVVLKAFQKPPLVLAYSDAQLFTAPGRTRPSHTFYKSDGLHFISTGISTLKKVAGLHILLATSSFIAGVAGLLYVLVSGIWQIFKFKRHVQKRPLFWCFFAILLILVSSVFLILQPFITLGNLTAGSFLMASATGLLPVFTIVSIYKRLKTGLTGLTSKADLIFLLLLLQLLIVLFLNDLIPFVLWK